MGSNLALQAENVCKRYRLGVADASSLKEIMTSGRSKDISSDTRDHIWALRDVSFTIEKGSSVGIIGRNGAGKSTLLKILSRVTLPTEGAIRGKGKIASLLEVGTGFHPELTGRENIFLNGQILGMSKRDIRSRFNEIVAFSGVETFLDTPVKRYSSGMYTRLSFSVAAHLDSDILIVDEALSVGDAEFQARSVRKMKELTAANGRTVLFVSHNMQAIRNLCDRIICLNNGAIADDGPTASVVERYLLREQVQFTTQQYTAPLNAPGNDHIRIHKTSITDNTASEGASFNSQSQLLLNIEFWKQTDIPLTLGIHIYSAGTCLADIATDHTMDRPGLIAAACTLPPGLLASGAYYISIDFINKGHVIYAFNVCLSFDINESNGQYSPWNGFLRPQIPVKTTYITDKI